MKTVITTMLIAMIMMSCSIVPENGVWSGTAYVDETQFRVTSEGVPSWPDDVTADEKILVLKLIDELNNNQATFAAEANVIIERH
jgi:hypothetical protein